MEKSMKHIINIFFVTLLLIVEIGHAQEKRVCPELIKAINEQKETILQIYENIAKYSPLKKITDNFYGVDSLRAGLKPTISDTLFKRIDYLLFTIGTKPDFFTANGFIDNEVIFRLMLKELPCGYPITTEEILTRLITYGKPTMLNSYTDEIKRSLKNYQGWSKYSLIALLKMDTTDRKFILENKNRFPEWVSMRAGDILAEKELIKLFEKEEDPFKKGKYAEELGYVGTNDCAIALVKALNTPLVDDKSNTVISVRYWIILALGRINTEEPLLTKEIRKIRSMQDEAYGKERLNIYAQELNKWAKMKYGIIPDDTIPQPKMYLSMGNVEPARGHRK